MGIDITQWRIEIAKYWKYMGRRHHSQGKPQGVKTASATSCNPLLALMLAFCLITAPSLLLVAGDVERNPGPPKQQKSDVESKLSIDDLGDVLEAVFSACTKSYNIGLKLRIPVAKLDSIKAQFSVPEDKLREILKVWLKTTTKPTWQSIVVALRSPLVGELNLATDIEAKYCTAVKIGQTNGQTMSKVQPTATDIQLQTIGGMKWQKTSKAPEEMVRGSAASDSNTAYFNGDGSTKVYSYDCDKWCQLPDTPHTCSTLVMVRNMLAMVGGHLSDKVTNSLHSLVEEGGAMKWLLHFKPMPTARCRAAAMSSGHSLIVAGGSDGNNSLSTVEVLDTDAQQWSTACSLPHPFSLATISICGNQLYLTGGYDKTGRTRSVLTCSVHELLQCQKQPLAGNSKPRAQAKQTTKWEHVYAPHYFSSCITLNGKLVVVGGRDGDKNTSAIFGYNEIQKSWERIGDMPTSRSLALVAILDGKMIAVGGYSRGELCDQTLQVRWSGTETDVVEILQ